MTRAGLEALEKELEELKTVRRKDVAEKIKVARGFGDLSENSEYDEAKNEQGFIESRIAQLEAMLKHARVIDNDDLSLEHVSVGTHVKIEDEDGEVEEYDITGSTEADPLNGKISDESPVGAGLLGKRWARPPRSPCPTGPPWPSRWWRSPVRRCKGPFWLQNTRKFCKNRCHGTCFCVIIRLTVDKGRAAAFCTAKERIEWHR